MATSAPAHFICVGVVYYAFPWIIRIHQTWIKRIWSRHDFYLFQRQHLCPNVVMQTNRVARTKVEIQLSKREQEMQHRIQSNPIHRPDRSAAIKLQSPFVVSSLRNENEKKTNTMKMSNKKQIKRRQFVCSYTIHKRQGERRESSERGWEQEETGRGEERDLK